MLRQKISAFLPHIAKQPRLLSHFVHELIKFDVTLKEEWDYDGGNSVEGWRGLAWEVLVKRNWFGTWLDVEKTCERILSKVLRHDPLMFPKSPYLDIKVSLTKKRAERLTSTVSMLAQLNPQMPPFGSTTCLKLSRTAIDLCRPSPRSCDFSSTSRSLFLTSSTLGFTILSKLTLALLLLLPARYKAFLERTKRTYMVFGDSNVFVGSMAAQTTWKERCATGAMMCSS